MERNSELYMSYIKILRNELIPAMGCTEPIAIALCASKAKELLGTIPDRIKVELSGNVIKNAKSVVVPNTNGAKGILVAVAVGVLAGDSNKGLEVIAEVPNEIKEYLDTYISKTDITVKPTDSNKLLEIAVTVYCDSHFAKVIISDAHTKIVYMKKDDVVMLNHDSADEKQADNIEYKKLNVAQIYDFANTVAISDIGDIIERQIRCNCAIVNKGLTECFGSNIGKILLNLSGNTSIKNRAKAFAAAASDARMNGCEMPVVINSGSGNQGITVSVPVIEYAREFKKTDETLFRALVVSNLIALHLKSGIGKLSAFCGVVCASTGAAAGIAYLFDATLDVITKTIINSLAIASGMVCDGAKSSCAAKIAVSLESSILAYEMSKNRQYFLPGDGIVGHDAERTIDNIGKLARLGMYETDRVIIEMMTTM